MLTFVVEKVHNRMRTSIFGVLSWDLRVLCCLRPAFGSDADELAE